jgi:hypothetical protein
MTGEDCHYCSGNETGKPVAVDHEDDDWWLGAMRGVEPTMLVRFARLSWSGPAAPVPELGQIEPWPPSKNERDHSLRPRRIDETRQQSTVLTPAAQDDGPLQARTAYKDVVRRSGMNWRGENKHRRQSSHKS